MTATSTQPPDRVPSSCVQPPTLEAAEPSNSGLPAAREESRGDASASLASLARLTRGVLRSRVGLVSIAAAVVTGGLAFGWEWLAVAGVLPLVLSVLPCVAMCALGLCMMKRGDGKSCSTQEGSGGSAMAKPGAGSL